AGTLIKRSSCSKSWLSVSASATSAARRLFPLLPESGNGKAVSCLGVGDVGSAATRGGRDGVGSGGGSSKGRGSFFMSYLRRAFVAKARRDSAESSATPRSPALMAPPERPISGRLRHVHALIRPRAHGGAP